MTTTRTRTILSALATLSLTGCGGGGGSSSSTASYTVGGTVTGLTAGRSVSLIDNGDNRYAYVVTGNGAFTFARTLASGASYDVAVGTQPYDQKCSVGSGNGTVTFSDVTDVSVACRDLGLTVLHTFDSSAGDGALPLAGLAMDDNLNLYGTTPQGGANGYGTVFKVDASGNETVLHSFGSGTDGVAPRSRLIMDASGDLYGTTYQGGAYNFGTVFEIDSSGHETVLHSFSGDTDGGNPTASLIMDASGNLYGTSSFSTIGISGTVFEIDSGGVFSVLHSFNGSPDGATPVAGLLMESGGNLYGTTSAGGANGSGTAFEIDARGSETVLHSFGSGTDGTNPQGQLIADANGNLYGTTLQGGASGNGTVFKIDTSKVETVLYSFSGGSDGGQPSRGLIMDANGNLYGTTVSGGADSNGTVFKIDTSNVETVLHSFSGSSDGGSPNSALIADASGDLYGTSQGGTTGDGTVFRYVYR